MTAMLVWSTIAMSLPAAGGLVGGWCWLRDRRQLARAFARGRTEHVVRLPLQVEPLPVLCRREAG